MSTKYKHYTLVLSEKAKQILQSVGVFMIVETVLYVGLQSYMISQTILSSTFISKIIFLCFWLALSIIIIAWHFTFMFPKKYDNSWLMNTTVAFLF